MSSTKIKGFTLPIAQEALRDLQASAQPIKDAAAATKKKPPVVATTFRLNRDILRAVAMKLLELNAPQGGRARDRIVEQALEAWLKSPVLPAP